MDSVTTEFLHRFDNATEQIPRLRKAGYESWLQEKLTLRREVTDKFFSGQANPSYEQMKGQLRAIVTVIITLQGRLLRTERVTAEIRPVQQAYQRLLRRCSQEQSRITRQIRAMHVH